MGVNDKSEEADAIKFENEDENPERGNWTGKLDFLLSCLGYAVGLGNVWRFPYLCFKFGGGAFLVPYAIMLLSMGIPCFLLELAIGQYSAQGPIVAFSNIAPVFKGLGLSTFLVSAFVGIYYNLIIAWTIYYLFASFTSQLPWDTCNNDYNSDFCFNTNGYANCSNWRNESKNENIIFHNGKCLHTEEEFAVIRANLSHFYGCTKKTPIYENENDVRGLIKEYSEEPGIFINQTECVDLSEASNLTKLFDVPYSLRVPGSQEYLDKVVLNKSPGIDNMGNVEWHLALCMLAAWVIVFLCLIKGIKSSGKVVYFTATFPYAMLVILLIKALTLPGAYEGIRFYMVPDWSKLSDIKVWEAAAVQIFFSLSVAQGGLTTLASYNKFHNNVLRDTMLVCFGNCFTSVFAGFVIFSILGFLAHETGLPVKDVVKGGTGLAFVAYPDLVTRLPIAPLWSFLFFAMLLTLGLDSEFALIETVVTGLQDYLPKLRSKHIYVVGGVCCVGFICSLPLVTGGGIYLLDLLDSYVAGWPYLFIAFIELIIVSYVYGFQNFLDDLCHMANFKPGLWLKSHMVFIFNTLSPLLIVFILIISWTQHKPLTSGGYQYPVWADRIGMAIAFFLMLAPVVIGIIFAFQTFFIKHADANGFCERCRKTFDSLVRPKPEWRFNAKRATCRNAGADSNSTKGVDNVAMTSDIGTHL